MSPAELEAVLMIHTEILEAAVIGTISSNGNGDSEVPRAYIVRAPNSDLSESDIKIHMATYLAKYKNLDGGIIFTDRIPRTSTGKIDRKALKDRAKLESQDSHIKNLVVTAFSSLRKARQPCYDEPKMAIASSYGCDGIAPVSPTTTASEYSDVDDGARREAARASRYYYYGMECNTSEPREKILISYSKEIETSVEDPETWLTIYAEAEDGVLDQVEGGASAVTTNDRLKCSDDLLFLRSCGVAAWCSRFV